MLYRYRKYIAICLLGLILIGGIWGVLAYMSQFQSVKVSYDTADVTKLELYRAFESKGVLTLDGDKIQDIESGRDYTLSKDTYALKPSGDKIKTDLIRLDVGDIPLNQTVDIDYNTLYLDSVLKSETAAITQALFTSNQKIQELYVLNPGVLYKKGQWYGTTLSYKGSNPLERDTLRVILVKKDGVWSVAAKPSIVIAAPAHNTIPTSVLKAVNAVDIGIPLMPGMSSDPIITYPGGSENGEN